MTNVGYSYKVPVIILINSRAIIWASHIAWDSALGNGIKFENRFNNTHLGEIGIKKAK